MVKPEQVLMTEEAFVGDSEGSGWDYGASVKVVAGIMVPQ